MRPKSKRQVRLCRGTAFSAAPRRELKQRSPQSESACQQTTTRNHRSHGTGEEGIGRYALWTQRHQARRAAQYIMTARQKRRHVLACACALAGA